MIVILWNAKSMFQIGSNRLCLRDCLLQELESITKTYDLPIGKTLITANGIIETQPNMTSESILKGKLAIEVQHSISEFSQTASLVSDFYIYSFTYKCVFTGI